MLLIPAVDIKDGRCVRLRQGKMDEETVYSEDPVAMARHWVERGARRLHVVDLDGSLKGRPVNLEIVHRIVEACPGTPVQVGGGIRDEDTIQAYLDAGVNFVIIGTKAVTAPHFVADACLEFPTHIIVGLDARDGKLAIDGWSKLSHHDPVDFAQQLEADGVAALIYTDVSRDGMLDGVNVEATVALAREVAVPVFAAGGVTDLEDLKAIAAVAEEGVAGVITGRAIYEGTLDYAAGQQLVDELTGDSAG